MTGPIWIVIVISSMALYAWKDLRSGYVAKIADHLTFSIPIKSRAISPSKKRIAGTVVAYDNGLQLTDGPCRQSIVVHVTPTKGKPNGEYLAIRYNYPCNAKGLPDEMFQRRNRWQFMVTRDSSCDQTFEGLKDLIGINPGGGVYKMPLMKIVPGADTNRIPVDMKLQCYRLRAGQFKSLQKLPKR